MFPGQTLNCDYPYKEHVGGGWYLVDGKYYYYLFETDMGGWKICELEYQF